MRIPINKIIWLCCFLLVVSISLFLPFLKIDLFIKIAFSIIPIVITILLFKFNFSLFVPTLFFTIHSVLSPFISLLLKNFLFNTIQLQFIIPIIIYIILIILFKKLRTEINWLRLGKIDKITILLILAIVIVSAAGLIIWALFIQKDLTKYYDFLPQMPLLVMLLYGLAFPLFNAILEEFMARAVLYDGFNKLFANIIIVILAQALIFSLWHFNGFPGGITGVVMVFIWSVFLGVIRHRSQGMLAPLIAHFFADLTIGGILFFVYILPVRYTMMP